MQRVLDYGEVIDGPRMCGLTRCKFVDASVEGSSLPFASSSAFVSRAVTIDV